MPKYPETKQRTLEYEESPSGLINIGKWEPPFARVEGGHGFMGVIAEDVETGKLQCHACGKWCEMLSAHIGPSHGMDSNEYRERYGLLRSTALKSMRIRRRQSEVMHGMRKKHKKHRGGFKKNNEYAANKRGKKTPVEAQNKYGVCELQIAERIMLLAKKLGRTPALTDVIEEYGGGTASIIHNRFRSYISLCRQLGLEPRTSSHNPKYSREYFVEKAIRALEAEQADWSMKGVFNSNERRYIYTYFGSFGEFQADVERALA